MPAETLDEARDRLRPYVERALSFSGWDNFPPSRDLDGEPSWDYIKRGRELASKGARILNIGTGGGERLEEIIDGLAVTGVATEEWPTNVPVAKARLDPHGIDVVHCADEVLPLASESFDLVLNRHSALDPLDVARVLRRGGTLFTQQVGNDNWDDIRAFLPRKTEWGDHYTRYREGFERGGLSIVRQQRHAGRAAFASLGEFVYMLCVASWEVPAFEPLGADLSALLAMEAALSTPHGFVVTETRYIIEAYKPR